MKIIKRNGSEAVFDISKIIAAVTKANNVVASNQRLTKEQITAIADDVAQECQSRNHAMNVEEIQDLVEDAIMQTKAYEVARKYITYRYVQSLRRTHNTTDDRILSLIECNNEEVKQENANKNPTVNSVQRDYMAGEVSKDLTMRMLLPAEIVKAHEDGIIHFHDADYYAQHMHNCDLVNLDDMLQNGTVISGTLIEKPHSFSTACNIATQIIAQVASNQYGGQSISLTHLAPFVEEMQRLHMLVDVSHLSDAGIWDILRVAKRPFVASHSNARACCPHVRNLTDEMLTAMGEKGCLIGLNYCASFLDTNPDRSQVRSRITDMARHARYIMDKAGEDCLALGSDFDGIDGDLEIAGAQDMPKLAEGLKKEGIPERVVEKIFYGNAVRFFSENL